MGRQNTPKQALASLGPLLAKQVPLRILPDGRTWKISSGHKDQNPSRSKHDGADLMYRRIPSDRQPIGDGESAKRFIMGTDAICFPSEAGIVHRASDTKTGHRVWVNHAGGYATGYFHLAALFVSAGDVVTTQSPLGPVGDNPIGHDPSHVHFVLSALPSPAYRPIDPTAYLMRGIRPGSTSPPAPRPRPPGGRSPTPSLANSGSAVAAALVAWFLL